MQACSTASGLHAPAHGARKPARLARGSMAARPARRSVAPVAALDPSAVEALYQVQEFGLTIMGVGIVSTFAAGMAQTLRRAAATYTTTAAATVAAEAPAAAPVAAAAPATALEQQPAAPVQKAAPVAAPAPVAPVLELSDIKSELQQAAAAAVAAVKSAAAAEPAPPAKPAAVAPAPAANGAAVKPGLTVEEATQQVKDWISAWQTSSESKPAESLEFPAREAAPTTRVTEPSLPSSAAAVLNAMTADAPVGATPVGEEGPASQGPPTEEKELTAVAAAAAPAEPAADGGAAEKEAEYKARISAGAVMADAKQQQAAKAQRVADQMRKRVVEMGVGYQAKIDSLWQGYESKKAEEAALLAKSEAILANLAEREAEERRLQESIAELEAARKSQAAEVEQGPLPSLLARILAFFQQIQSWLQQLWASLTGGSGSGSAAGASA